MGAALHQLKVIFETNLTSLGRVAEGAFQGCPDLTGCGEADSFSHGFLCERGEEKTEETLVSCFPC
jgi:hypothetical protein